MTRYQNRRLRRISRNVSCFCLSAFLLLSASGCSEAAAVSSAAESARPVSLSASSSGSASSASSAESASSPGSASSTSLSEDPASSVSGSPLQSLTPVGDNVSATEPARETIDAFFRAHGADQINDFGELITFSGGSASSGSLDYNETRTVLENIGFQLYGAPSDEESVLFFSDALAMLFPETDREIWVGVLQSMLAEADEQEHFHTLRSGNSIIHFITRAPEGAAPAREMMVDMSFPG